jgi:type VI secretion system protein ImpK
MDFFLLGLQISSNKIELPNVEALRRRVLMLFDTMKNRAHKVGISPSDVEEGSYALAAYLDEMIHYSAWPGKEEWSANPLQAVLFGESKAGANFFQRLEQVAKLGSQHALEVFYYCLVLGFKGEYSLAAPEQHDRLVDDVLQELTGGREKKLSVHGVRSEGTRFGRRSLPVLPLALLCLAVSAIVVVLLYLLLSSQGTDSVELLQQLGRT